MEEIARCIGARAPAAAHHHLKRLEAKGYLRRTAWGSYELTHQVQMLEGLGVARVPVRGTIAAGTGVEAVEAVEDWLTVDSVFARHRTSTRCACRATAWWMPASATATTCSFVPNPARRTARWWRPCAKTAPPR